MTKPRLVKVRALFYGFQYITKQRGCANFDTASLTTNIIYKTFKYGSSDISSDAYPE